MMKPMAWYLGACPNCGGDMHDDFEDKGWITCLLCSRSVKLEARHREQMPFDMFASAAALVTSRDERIRAGSPGEQHAA